jgi:cation/acetate symporter
LRGIFGVTTPLAEAKWFEIEAISAGVFGVPIGFLVIILVSLVTPAPAKRVQDFIEHVRYPHLKGSALDTRAT